MLATQYIDVICYFNVHLFHEIDFKSDVKLLVVLKGTKYLIQTYYDY